MRTGSMIAWAAAALLASACTRSQKTEGQASEPSTASGAPSTSPGAAEAKVAPAPAQPEKLAKVHCTGVNSCKGQSGCKTAKNACAGQNGCKGQGYVELTAEECTSKGGQVLAEK